MKSVYYIILSTLVCNTYIHPSAVSAADIAYYNRVLPLQNISNDQFTDMDDWDDERIKRYEDSIKSVLYPQPIEKERERPKNEEEAHGIMPTSSGSISSIKNSHVPDYAYIDIQKAVGEIKIESSITPSGARSYNVPIDICAGNGGLSPNISLSYNSQGRNGIIGMGWNISGLSMISRCTKSIYYDGKTQSAQMNKSDAFTLDGTRLIKSSEESDGYLYKTEIGNIKVKAYLNGNIVKYFKVFYPDGATGIFGYTSNTLDKLFYPVTELTDARGNKINFTYTYSNNRYAIKNIQYNGATIEFTYTTTRPDTLISYNAGLKIMENSLLQSIICQH